MLVHLKKDAQSFIERKVSEGEFRDADEAIDVAVRQMAERDDRLRELREALQIGIDQLDRGEGIEVTPEYFDNILANAKQRVRARQASGRNVGS